ncbi:MAG: hypothetical protein DHS20C09_04760 [marine bacterium B5-7]|nr:MAG: hypothetical protein DHS20C09_04760 [marine bacterium B5-7]
MTQQKYKIMRAHYYMPKHHLSIFDIDNNYLEGVASNEARSHGQLRQTLQNVFSVFSTGEDNTIAKQNADNTNAETKVLRDIENCANAAREIGVCGQNRWVI